MIERLGKDKMTEEQHVDEIRALKRGAREITPATFARIEAALAAYPLSPRLWCIRGDCIQLGAEDSSYVLRDALASYERALKIDPRFAEAHESVGYYFDVIEEDLAKAEVAFVTAIEFGGGSHSYSGLARVMAERGRDREEILAMLARCSERDSSAIREARQETLRGEWERPKKEPNQAQEPTAPSGRGSS